LVSALRGVSDNLWERVRAGVAACAAWAVLLALSVAAQDLLQVQVAIESQDVFVGQPITFQITVSGADEPQPPDLAAAAPDLSVQYAGPRTNNSTQISIVNGRMNKVVTRETILTYQVTAKRAGQLTIPALTVQAGAKQARTQPVPLRVRAPESAPASADITLRMELSRDTVCVGEPIVVNWTWTVGSEVRGFDFQLPLFEQPGFDFPKMEPEIDPQLRDRYIGIRLPDGRQLVALQTPRRTPTGGATDVTFSQVMIPRQAGSFALPKSTVTCDVASSAPAPRRRSATSGDPFFGDPFGQRDRTYRRLAVASGAPTLTVRPLPAAGKPTGFAGHVGHYELRARAEPVEVSVGDPITLTVELSGPDYLETVEGPDLEGHEELARGFRLSPPEPGVVAGRAKVFKRVLRAKNAAVTGIPALRLPYYDTAAQAYRVAESAPIPLTVKAAKLVTAMDAEGSSAPVAAAGRKLQASGRGIAANYEDSGVLTDQYVGFDTWMRSWPWGVALVLPPLLYAALFAGVFSVRRRQADPAARQARQALARARRQLKLAGAAPDGPAQVAEALREYFGAKLRLTSGALVFGDLEAPLREQGIGEAERAALKGLFQACEVGRYAGAGAATPVGAELAETARRLLDGLDRKLKSP
jgi:hypothetical protein